MQSAPASIVMPVPAVIAEVAALFAAAGLSASGARRIAIALVEAEQQGLASHGLMHAPLYIERLRKGSVSPLDEAELVSDVGAVAVLDAHHMLGHLAGEQAMSLAIDKAKRFGIGAVAVRHGFHFGAAGRYAAQATQAGVVGIAMSNTRPLMPAPGGVEPVVGNNPLAIALPVKDEAAVVADIAMSEGALGKIRHHNQRGEPIPANWAVTSEGLPTTDPAEAIKGLLLPTGGPKGFALAFAIDLLCGLLSGGAVGAEVQGLYGDTSRANDCSFLFIALDPVAFGASELPERASKETQRMRIGRHVPGMPAICTPGQLKAERASSSQDSVSLDGRTWAAIKTLGG